MRIPLASPSRENTAIQAELTEAFHRFFKSGTYVLGGEVSSFESEFADYLGVSACVSVANGTDALRLAMQGLGLQAGDKIGLAANAGGYAAVAARSLGVDLEYFDVTPSGHIDVDWVAKDLKRRQPDARPKAIVYTHLFGGSNLTVSDVEKLESLGTLIIEDCAQSAGLKIESRQSGTLGAVGTYSFYPTKNLGALGDGGAIATNHSRVAEQVRLLRQYGWAQKYNIAFPGGINSRMDEIQAAVLRRKLHYLDEWNNARSQNANKVIDLSMFKPSSFLSTRASGSVQHLFVIDTEALGILRVDLAEYLSKLGIETGIHYPIPDYRQPGFGLAKSPRLKETERQCRSFLTLPMGPHLLEEEINHLGKSLKNFPH